MNEWSCHLGRAGIAEDIAGAAEIRSYKSGRESQPAKQIEALEGRKNHQSNLRLANFAIEAINPGTIFRTPCRPIAKDKPDFRLVSFEKIIDSQHILIHPLEGTNKPTVSPISLLKDAGILCQKDNSPLLEINQEMLDFYLHQTQDDLVNQLSVSEQIRQRHCHRV